MTISVLQEKQISPGASFATFQSLAFTSNVTAGSTIHAIFQYVSPSVPLNFSDNNGNTWTSGVLDTVDDTAGGTTTCHQILQNANAGATTVTATFTSASRNFLSLWIKEIGGAATTGQPLAHNAAASGSTTSQTVSATIGSAPALMSCLTTNSSTLELPSLDATYTASSANPGWNYGGSTSATIAGSKRVTGTGSQSVTNTQASADGLATVLVAIAEAATSAVMGPKYMSMNP